MKTLTASLIVAGLLWGLMFSPWTAGLLNFWFALAFSASGLALWGLLAERREILNRLRWQPRFLTIGIISAAVLYGIFQLGHAVISLLSVPAVEFVSRVYNPRALLSLPWITVLLLLIAPAEEIYWRGFVQRRLSSRLGQWRGLLCGAAAYSLVHVWAFNPMLLIAALICGLFWGWMFIRYDSLWPGIISHTLWDLAIFVVWPVV